MTPSVCANCGHIEPHNGPAGAVSDACTHEFCDCAFDSRPSPLTDETRARLAPLLTIKEDQLDTCPPVFKRELDAQRRARAEVEQQRDIETKLKREARDAQYAAESRLQALKNWVTRKRTIALEDANNPCFDTSLRNDARQEAKYMGRVLERLTSSQEPQA